MDLIITILPVVTKDLLISPRFTPYNFLSRYKVSTLTTRQPMVEFYLLTFPRFPLRKKEHKSYFGKNRTHDFRTSRCAAYLLDHSGDELFRGFLRFFASLPPSPIPSSFPSPLLSSLPSPFPSGVCLRVSTPVPAPSPSCAPSFISTPVPTPVTVSVPAPDPVRCVCACVYQIAHNHASVILVILCHSHGSSQGKVCVCVCFLSPFAPENLVSVRPSHPVSAGSFSTLTLKNLVLITILLQNKSLSSH